MRRSVLIALPVGLAVLGAIACGGAGNQGATRTATGSTATPISAGGSATAASPSALGSVQIPPGAAEIDQQNLAFTKDNVTVKFGDKVYFKSRDDALHTIDVNGVNSSGTMHKGDVFAWAAGAPGIYKITCDFHPQMHATITVQ